MNANPFGAPSQPEEKTDASTPLANPFAPPAAPVKNSSAMPPPGQARDRRLAPQQVNALAKDLRYAQETKSSHFPGRQKSPAAINGRANQPATKAPADRRRRDDRSAESRPRPKKPQDWRAAQPSDETRKLSSFAGDFADKLNKQLRKDGLGSTPQWPAEPGNPDKRGPMERLKETYKKYRAKVYSSLRKAELIDDPDKRRKLEDALPFKGVCEDMCPEYEQLTRICEFDVKQEEKDRSPDGTTTWAEPPLMVKKFGRSAAGQDAPLPMDVRSVDALKRTTGYLLGELLQRDEDLPTLHNFLWDRTRAVRKDFTFHSTKTADEMKVLVHCFETITRFHATALHLLSRKGFAAEDFDQKQEIEQLGRSLLSLMEAYDDCREKGVECENESEFRAYHLLLNTHDPFIVQRSREWGQEPWFDSDEVQLALSLIHAMQNVEEPRGPLRPQLGSTLADSSFTNFFSIVESPQVSYTMACFAEVHFTYVRQRILRAVVKAYSRRRDWPKDITAPVLNNILRFDAQDEAVEFAEQHDFEFTTENADQPYLVLKSKRKHVPSPRVLQSYSGKLIERKRNKKSLPHVIHHTTFEEPTTQDEAEDGPDVAERESSPDSLFVSQDDSPALSEAKPSNEPAKKAEPGNSPFGSTPSSSQAPIFGSMPSQTATSATETTPSAQGINPPPNPFAPQDQHPPLPSAASAIPPAPSASGSSPFASKPAGPGTFSFLNKGAPEQTHSQASQAPSSSSLLTPSAAAAAPTASFFPSEPPPSFGNDKGAAFSAPSFPAPQPEKSNQTTERTQNMASTTPQPLPSTSTTISSSKMPPPPAPSAPSTSFFPSAPPPPSSSAPSWRPPIFPAPSSTPSLSSPLASSSFPTPTSTVPTQSENTAAPSILARAGAPSSSSSFGNAGINKSPLTDAPSFGPAPSTPPVPPFGQKGSQPAKQQPGPGALDSLMNQSQALENNVPPAAPKDPIGSFTNWFVLGDEGLLDEFMEVTVTDLVHDTFKQWEEAEAERKRKEEDEASWAAARKFQIYNLRVKFFYRWQKNARALAQRRILREGKAKLKAFREQERAAEKARQDAEQKAAEEARRKARSEENLAKLLRWETHRSPKPNPEKQLLATRVFSGCKNEQETARRAVRDAYLIPKSIYNNNNNNNSSAQSSRRSSFASSQDASPGKREGWKTRSLREKYGLEPSSRQRSISVSSSFNGRASFGRSTPPVKVTNFSRKRSAGDSSDDEPSPKRKPNGIKSTHWELRARGLVLMPNGQWLPESIALPMQEGRRFKGIGDCGLGPGRGQESAASPESAVSEADGAENSFSGSETRELRLERLAARFGFPESRRASISDAGKGGGSINADGIPRPTTVGTTIATKRKRSPDDDGSPPPPGSVGYGRGGRADGSPPSAKRTSVRGEGDEKGETDEMLQDTQRMLQDLRDTMDKMDEDRPWFREQVELMEKRQSMWG